MHTTDVPPSKPESVDLLRRSHDVTFAEATGWRYKCGHTWTGWCASPSRLLQAVTGSWKDLEMMLGQRARLHRRCTEPHWRSRPRVSAPLSPTWLPPRPLQAFSDCSFPPFPLASLGFSSNLNDRSHVHQGHHHRRARRGRIRLGAECHRHEQLDGVRSRTRPGSPGREVSERARVGIDTTTQSDAFADLPLRQPDHPCRTRRPECAGTPAGPHVCVRPQRILTASDRHKNAANGCSKLIYFVYSR